MARAARHWGMDAEAASLGHGLRGSVSWTCGVCPRTKERGSPRGERGNRARPRAGVRDEDLRRGVLDQDRQHGLRNKHFGSSPA